MMLYKITLQLLNNTAVGVVSLDANTTGSSNVALGYGSLNKNTTGCQIIQP
jgi:hypothetical protein